MNNFFYDRKFFSLMDYTIAIYKVDYSKNLVHLKEESINKKDILEKELGNKNCNKKIHYNKEKKIIELKEKINGENEDENED